MTITVEPDDRFKHNAAYGGDQSAFWFAAAIALMSATLSAWRSASAPCSQISRRRTLPRSSSGFGGTLCLVISFVYITFFIALAAVPGMRRVMHVSFFLSNEIALAVAVVLSLVILLLPMAFAIRRVKSLEF